MIKLRKQVTLICDMWQIRNAMTFKRAVIHWSNLNIS